MDHNSPTAQYNTCQQPPEISIEWRDVEIEVKVLGADLPPQETQFVRSAITLVSSQYIHSFWLRQGAHGVTISVRLSVR